MAKGLFVTGFTVSQVLGIQSAAADALSKGLTIVSYSDSGTSVSKSWPIPPSELLEECAYALKILEPDTYSRTKWRTRRRNYQGTTAQ